MLAEPSYYDLLEVRRDATPTDIANAFARAQVQLESLPPGSPAGRRRRQEVAEAFHVLSDASAKAIYDRRRFRADVGSPGASGAVEPDTGPATYIGAPAAESPMAPAARYQLVLRKAQRTEEGIEIELAPSARSRTAVAEELRRHVPSAFLRFNADRNSWTVAGAYEAVLRELFLNLDRALNEDAARPLQVFSVPRFGAFQPSPYPGSGPTEAKEPTKPEPRRSRWTATINGTTLGIVGMILLIGWNLYVAGAQRQQEPVSQVIAVRPTRTPIPTPTLVPTPVPTPVSFQTTTKFARVHLRAGPAQSTTSLGFLLADEAFTAVGRTADGEWIRIVKGDLTGWSAAWTLNVEERLDELPVLDAAGPATGG